LAVLFIYTPHDSPRLDFAMEFFFKNCLGLAISMVDDVSEVPEGHPFLVYSYVRPERDAVWIFPHEITLEFVLGEQQVEVFEYNGHPVFFGTGQDQEIPADLPYDPFAMAFFMLSRYEEYVSQERDMHDRFPASASLAAKNGFLEFPVVDHAAEDLLEVLLRKWPAMESEDRPSGTMLTYDIDSAFAFHGKGLVKNLTAGLMDTIMFRQTGRLGYVLGKAADPFDIFDKLLAQLDKYDQAAVFFLLLEHRGRHNPAVDYRNARFRAIVNKLAGRHQLGIHPSYACRDERALKAEIDRFTDLTGERPERSRFHFIRLNLPQSYLSIYRSGIFNDHSMGFPDAPGFRAGTCRNFRFYDLSAEAVTDLVLHPFALMDATFEYYFKQLDEIAVWDKITSITDRAGQTGCRPGWVFHNDLISDYPSRLDWAALHQKVLNGIS
jgi:hypothetical protein